VLLVTVMRVRIVENRKKQSRYRPGGAPEGSKKLRLPDFVTTLQDGGKVSALRTGRLYPSRKYSWYTHFC